MTASGLHPFARNVSRIQSALRQLPTGSQPLEPGQHIVPGFYVSWGGAGKVQVVCETQPGLPCVLRAEVSGTPGWFTLNLEIGTGRFLPGEIFGLALGLDAGEALALPAFLRSMPTIDGARDTEFATPLRLSESGGGGVLLHRLDPQDHAVAASEYHTLILRLPEHSFRRAITGMRAFVLPADRASGLAPDLPSLGQAFV